MLSDDRKKQIMRDLGMYDSLSLKLAIDQIDNEVTQQTRKQMQTEIVSQLKHLGYAAAARDISQLF